MVIRSFYVSWSQAASEGERLLERLAKWTHINTIELTNYDADWSSHNAELGRLVFPSQEPFKGLGLRLTTEERFDSLNRFMELARSRGFGVLCNFSPLYSNSAKFVPMTCVDVTGAPVPGINRLPAYGCPNNPAIVEYGIAMIREVVATWTSADLVAVNHVEFPFWADSSLHELFSCFCDSCKGAAAAEGIDLPAIQREVRVLYDSLSSDSLHSRIPSQITPGHILNYLAEHPGIGVLLDFRLRSMSKYVRAIVKAGREAANDQGRKVRIGLEFLPPSVSYAVGTDFASLSDAFDWLSPKFPEYLAGTIVPRIVEKARGTKATDNPWLMSAIRQLFALGDGPSRYRGASEPAEGLTYSNAFDSSMIDDQMPYLRPLINKKVEIHPYTWLYNGDSSALRSRLSTFRRYGLEGYMIWGWEWNLTEAALRKARRVF